MINIFSVDFFYFTYLFFTPFELKENITLFQEKKYNTELLLLCLFVRFSLLSFGEECRIGRGICLWLGRVFFNLVQEKGGESMRQRQGERSESTLEEPCH